MKPIKIEEFSEHTAQVLNHISSDCFSESLQKLLNSLAVFSNMFLLEFKRSQAPTDIFSWIPEGSLSTFYKENYFKFGFQLDPFYRLTLNNFANGAYTIRQIAPDRFFTSEYYKNYYLDAQMGDEIGILTQVSDDTVLHLSIGRLKFEPGFTKHEINRIRQHTALICKLLELHHQNHLQNCAAGDRTGSALPMEERLKQWCATDRDCDLTDREAQIAALILQGHSSMSAALNLDIATETVKVHRKNLYRKLRVGTQAELFALLSRLVNSP